MLLHQIIFTILMIQQFLNSFQYLDRFFGDVPIEDYFEKDLCPFAASKDRNSKLNIILLKMGHFKSNNPALAQFQHCFDTILVNDSSQITNPAFEYRELLVLVESYYQDNSLQATLKQLDLLYQKCHNCLPFYILLQDFSRIKQNIQTILPHLSLNFSATLLSTKPGNTILIRPILDGCSRYPRIFQPKTATDFARLRSSFKSCSLHNQTLTVSVNDSPPFCELKGSSNGSLSLKRNHFIDSNLLGLLERKYTFISTYISARQFWGIEGHPNGTFSGIVGQVYSGQADIGSCGLSLSLHRSQFVTFTHFTFYDYLSFLTMRPKVKSRKWIVANPFSGPVWLAILSCLLFLTFTLTNMRKYQHVYQKFSICTVLTQILLKQTQAPASFTQSSSMRIIFTAWLLGTLILSNAYSAVFYSYLAIPQSEQAVDSKADLLHFLFQTPNYLVTDELYFNAFRYAAQENTLYHRLGVYYNQSSAKRVFQIKLNDFLPKIMSFTPHFAYIHTYLYFELIGKYLGKRFNHIFHLGTEALNQDRVSVALQKRSPLIGPFNWAIQRFYEMGLLGNWRKRAFMHIPQLKSPNLERFKQKYGQTSTFQTVHLEDVTSVCLIWCLGICLAIGVFLFEFICVHFNK